MCVSGARWHYELIPVLPPTHPAATSRSLTELEGIVGEIHNDLGYKRKIMGSLVTGPTRDDLPAEYEGGRKLVEGGSRR